MIVERIEREEGASVLPFGFIQEIVLLFFRVFYCRTLDLEMNKWKK